MATKRTQRGVRLCGVTLMLIGAAVIWGKMRLVGNVPRTALAEPTQRDDAPAGSSRVEPSSAQAERDPDAPERTEDE